MSVLPHRVVVSFGLLVLGVLVAVAGLGPAPAGATGIDDLFVDAAETQAQGKNVVVKLTAGAAEVVGVSAHGSVRQGGRGFALRPAKATVAAARRATLELRPRKGWQERKILQALRKGKTLTATIHVRTKDFIGNTATRTLTILLT